MTPEPIDAVITWVDGDDPVLRAKREKYQGRAPATGTASTRFASEDEIVYCVLSILKYAPFFRSIHIVTDSQTPPIFDVIKKHFPDQLTKIRIVDHTDIFRGYEACLPTFNSISIGMQLYNIPDLAERYVYFNDDIILMRPVLPETFFEGSRPVLRGNWMGVSLNIVEGIKSFIETIARIPPDKRRLSSKRWMRKSARLAGVHKRTFIATHAPFALRKSTIDNFQHSHPDIWQENLCHRFRTAQQFVYGALSHHLEIAQGNAVITGRKALVYIRVERHDHEKIKRKLEKAEKDPQIIFLCVQNLDQASQKSKDMIQTFLVSKTQ